MNSMTGISRRNFLKAGAAFAASPSLLSMFEATAYGKGKGCHPRCREYDDAVLVKGEPPRPEPGSFTIVVLPDTQHYSEDYPGTFLAQTTWIAENLAARKIAAVIHL